MGNDDRPLQAHQPGHPEHPRTKFLALALLIILSLAFGFLGGWLGGNRSGTTSVQKEKVVLESRSELISSIATSVGESVVSVLVISSDGSDFFGTNTGEQQSAGTGIILTEGGLIVTNRHVVPATATQVDITLADGTEFEDVEVIGRTGENDSLDIAFLKITDTKGKKLVPAKLADSSKVKVGDAVVAIGNALGQFQNTVTAGIISGYGRSIEAMNSDGSDIDNLEGLFQTDAAINSGNSGGPLVNMNGEVIGINTAVASGEAQNIGFAIPVSDVSGLIKSVKEKGKLERPFLGVVYVPLTNDAAEFYKLSVKRGAYIAPSDQAGGDSIVDGSPAEKAGLKEGDVITKVDNTAVDESHSLSSLVNKHAVGDRVKLTVWRDGKEQVIEATLAAAPTN